MAPNKKIYIGTSGWDYKEWSGKFYPKNLHQKDKLKYYSQKLNTVEINSSFYHFPSANSFLNWKKQTPKDFIFTLKMNRTITHFKKLAVDSDTKKIITSFLQNTQLLGKKLGAILIQLPPNFLFKEKMAQKFYQFLSKKILTLQYKPKIAFEFRNETWLSQESLFLLSKHKFGLVISHSSLFPFKPAFSSNFCYIRFHGPKELFGSSYSKKELEYWQKFITNSPPKIRKFYIYFNNDMHAYAPQNALTLKELMSHNF